MDKESGESTWEEVSCSGKRESEIRGPGMRLSQKNRQLTPETRRKENLLFITRMM